MIDDADLAERLQLAELGVFLPSSDSIGPTTCSNDATSESSPPNIEPDGHSTPQLPPCSTSADKVAENMDLPVWGNNVHGISRSNDEPNGLEDKHEKTSKELDNGGDVLTTLNKPSVSTSNIDDLQLDNDQVFALTLQLLELGDEQSTAAPLTAQPATEAQPKGSAQSSDQTQVVSRAKRLLTISFPKGYIKLPTPGTGNRCGLFALILSYAWLYTPQLAARIASSLAQSGNQQHYHCGCKQVAQHRTGVPFVINRDISANTRHPNHVTCDVPVAQDQRTGAGMPPPPTLENLLAVVASPAYRTIMARPGVNAGLKAFLRNDSNFSPDQLDIILRLWGEGQGAKGLRVGYVVKSRGDESAEARVGLVGRQYDGIQNEGDQEKVVWILLEHVAASKIKPNGPRMWTGKEKGPNQGNDTSGGFGHYSGLKPR
jgi:hypothetical protein